MRALAQFIKATIIGGLLFLLPLALVIVAFQKLASILGPLADHSAVLFDPFGIGPGWRLAIVVATLLLSAFLAGLFGATVVGRGLFGWLENALLSRIPGYGIVRSAAADAAGGLAQIESSGRSNAVFVIGDAGWQIGFVVEQIGEDTFAIFLPDAPSAISGTVIFAASDKFVDSGLKVADALRCLRQLGAGSARLLLPARR